MNTAFDWKSRWERECQEWQAIKDELLREHGANLTAYDVSQEQQRRMRARGESPMHITRVGFISEVPAPANGGSP